MTRKITILALIMGIVLLVGGGSWLLVGGQTGKGLAVLAAGVGFALICFSQAARALTRPS
jgi:hypothetical protein